MNYVELDITTSDDMQSEILTALLAEYPFESFMTEDGCLKAYIRDNKLDTCRADVDMLLDEHGDLHRIYTVVETQNWNASWESGFDAVDVDGRLLIRAPFHAAAPQGVQEVVLMPHMSFGTGHHATTYLMTSALLDLDVSEHIGLDMGSGTGVLAIVAVQQGAKMVDAVDIDEWADQNCRANADMNGVLDRITPLLGDVSRVAGRCYDFILANINRNILIADMSAYSALLRSGGDLLLSGFLEQDASVVASTAELQGLCVVDTRLRNGWVMLRCRKL